MFPVSKEFNFRECLHTELCISTLRSYVIQDRAGKCVFLRLIELAKKLWKCLFAVICLRVLNSSQRCLYHEDVPLVRTYFKTITFNIQSALNSFHRYTHVPEKHDFINKHPPLSMDIYEEQKLFKFFLPRRVQYKFSHLLIIDP